METHVVKQGDTHRVWFVVRDEKTGLPLDLTDAEATIWLRRAKAGGNPLSFPLSIDNPAQGLLAFNLPGTLAAETYSYVIKMEKEGVQTTVPTDGMGCLIVSPSIGVPA